MSQKNVPTIESIIKKLGGCDKIAKDLDKTPALIRSWRQNGISWWWWHYIMKQGNFRAGEIYNACVLVAGHHYDIPKETPKRVPTKKETPQSEAA